MTSIYKRRDVLLELREMILPICSDIHTSNRETVKTTKRNAFRKAGVHSLAEFMQKIKL